MIIDTKKIVTGVLFAMTMGASVAQQQPTTIIKERQQGFKDLGAASKLVRDQLQSGQPDFARIKTAAGTIVHTTHVIEAWFPKGSGPESGLKTKAKPEIWTQPDAYAALNKKFVDQANAFAQLTARSRDVSELNVSIKALGQTCSGCHDKFRLKDD